MVMILGLVSLGFLLGILLAGLIACRVYGCLHAEAVTIVDAVSICRKCMKPTGV